MLRLKSVFSLFFVDIFVLVENMIDSNNLAVFSVYEKLLEITLNRSKLVLFKKRK